MSLKNLVFCIVYIFFPLTKKNFDVLDIKTVINNESVMALTWSVPHSPRRRCCVVAEVGCERGRVSRGERDCAVQHSAPHPGGCWAGRGLAEAQTSRWTHQATPVVTLLTTPPVRGGSHSGDKTWMVVRQKDNETQEKPMVGVEKSSSFKSNNQR